MMTSEIDNIMARALVAHGNANNCPLIDRCVLRATEQLWQRVSAPLFEVACQISEIIGVEDCHQRMRRHAINEANHA